MHGAVSPWDTLLPVNVTGWEALLFYSVVLIVLAILGCLAWVLLRGRRAPDT